jgi:hypothetical protein
VLVVVGATVVDVVVGVVSVVAVVDVVIVVVVLVVTLPHPAADAVNNSSAAIIIPGCFSLILSKNIFIR